MSSSRTALFRDVVRDHLRPPPLAVGADEPCAAVVRRMAVANADTALVIGADGVPQGILTEHDIARRIACQSIAERPVRSVVTTPVLTIHQDDLLYQGIGFMRRQGLGHIVAVDDAGVPTGTLHMQDALAAAAARQLGAIDTLTHDASVDGLRHAKAAQVALAEDLLADHVPVPDLLALIDGINADLHRGALAHAQAAMHTAGHGPPPVGFALLVMGSIGRGESQLAPDQDNGLILADYPDAKHGPIDGYFRALAERFTATLAAIGFPLCPGGVMATNPAWRKSLPQWRAQLNGWLRSRSDAALQYVDILADFCCLGGNAALASELRREVTARLAANSNFLAQMYGIQAPHAAGPAPLSKLLPWRRQRPLNLKQQGTLPLAEAARLAALTAGVEATGTLARLRALTEAGILSADDGEELCDAFSLLVSLQLRQQIADHHAGRPPGHGIDALALSRRERRAVTAAFDAINGFRARVRARVTGAVF